jgi:ketosteroid isomerase-like protein
MMSGENVEAFRQAIAAYNRRDIDAFLEAFDPMVEIHPLTLAMFGQEAAVYRGHDGIRRFIRDVDEVLPHLQVEPLEIRDLGERIVASGRLRARGRASGAEVDSPIGWVVEFSEGRVTRMRDYLDPEQALQAVGLRE